MGKLKASGRQSLLKVADFYKVNMSIIERNRRTTLDFVTGQPTQRFYTRAKVIDMIFFIEGMKKTSGSD
jgi:hypothetical protein